MRPIVLAVGCMGFFICLAAHVALWRLRRPKNDLHALFFIFLGLPLLACALTMIALQAGLLSPDVFSKPEALAALLLSLALAAVYVQSYPTAQAVSPSLKILLVIGAASGQGLTAREIGLHFNDASLVSNRLDDLLATKLARENNGRLELTPSGRTLVRFFVLYRNYLGLEYKGG